MTARVSRRRFLQASAGAVAGLSLTALDRAPALAQKRELTFLSWNHFVPAADDVLSGILGLKSRSFVEEARVGELAPADATVTVRRKAAPAWVL